MSHEPVTSCPGRLSFPPTASRREARNSFSPVLPCAGVGTNTPAAQLQVEGTDATDGAGASAIDALTVTAGDGGDGTDPGGEGGGVSLTSGIGGAATGGNNGGQAAILAVLGGIGGTSGGGGAGGSITLTPGAGGSGEAGGAAGNVLLASTGSGNVGVGTTVLQDKSWRSMEACGLNTVTSKPACTSSDAWDVLVHAEWDRGRGCAWKILH